MWVLLVACVQTLEVTLASFEARLGLQAEDDDGASSDAESVNSDLDRAEEEEREDYENELRELQQDQEMDLADVLCGAAEEAEVSSQDFKAMLMELAGVSPQRGEEKAGTEEDEKEGGRRSKQQQQGGGQDPGTVESRAVVLDKKQQHGAEERQRKAEEVVQGSQDKEGGAEERKEERKEGPRGRRGSGKAPVRCSILPHGPSEPPEPAMPPPIMCIPPGYCRVLEGDATDGEADGEGGSGGGITSEGRAGEGDMMFMTIEAYRGVRRLNREEQQEEEKMESKAAAGERAGNRKVSISRFGLLWCSGGWDEPRAVHRPRDLLG